MATHEFAPVLGKRIRVTTLDDCANVTSASRSIATDGFVTATLTAETEDGTEIIKRNAQGHICVNERLANSFKRFTVAISFCAVNPSLLAMVTNVKEYEDWDGDVAGFTVPEGEISGQFALELWSGLSGTQCLPGQVDEASGYLLLPFVVNGVLGDIELGGENAVDFSLTGAYTKGGNNWGVGHSDVLRDDEGAPSPLPTELDPFDHLLMIDTALAPPPVATEPLTITIP